MQKWKILIPYDTLIWLDTMKAIASFEFFPKKWFTDYISDRLGLEFESADESQDIN